MIYKIVENTKNNILAGDDITNLSLTDFSILLEESFPEKMIASLIQEDGLVNMLNIPEEIRKTIVDYIIKNKSIEELKNYLTEKRYYLYSLLIQVFNSGKRKYNNLCNLSRATKLIFSSTTSNLKKVLNIAKQVNCPVKIDAHNIPITKFKTLLSKSELELLEDKDIKVYYQKHNSHLSLGELYNLSNMVSSIVEEIQRYNLSPFEQVMYVYDRVKSRIYKECEENKRLSRDIDKVLSGDSIVCVGYSNLFNTILKSLGIKVEIIYDKTHQRSIAYLKDDKYTIDGVFAFDPTWDCKKRQNDTSYLNNYKYFAIPIEVSEKTLSSGLLTTLNYSFFEIVDIMSEDINFELGVEILGKLEFLFSLISYSNFDHFKDNLDLFNYSNFEEKKKLVTIHKNIISKYLNQSLSEDIFISALYNVRKLEYYKGMIEDLDIEEMSEAVSSRYYQKERAEINRSINSKSDIILNILEMLTYEEDLLTYLEEIQDKIAASLPSEDTPYQDREKLRLVRTLRKIVDKSKSKI